LANDGQIEASRNPTKLIGGPGEACVQRQRLGRNPGTASRCGEILDRRFSGCFVVSALNFDDFRGM
jgi:hypothetical protein